MFVGYKILKMIAKFFLLKKKQNSDSKTIKFSLRENPNSILFFQSLDQLSYSNFCSAIKSSLSNYNLRRMNTSSLKFQFKNHSTKNNFSKKQFKKTLLTLLQQYIFNSIDFIVEPMQLQINKNKLNDSLVNSESNKYIRFNILNGV